MGSNDNEVDDGVGLRSNRSNIADAIESHPNAWSPWTNDQNEELLELVKSGVGWPEIGERMGRTSGAVKQQAARLAFDEVFGRSIPDRRVPERGENRPWDPEEVVKLTELVVDASSWEEIGEALGRDPAMCRRRAERAALDSIMP